MSYLKSLKNWLLPSVCVCCDANVKGDLDLCDDCKTELPWNNNYCLRCAISLPKESSATICGPCLQHPPIYQHTSALFSYQYPIDNFITKLKFQQQLVYARLLSELFIERFANKIAMPDCVIPVPLHTQRLRERGFNQALEIVKPIAKKFNIHVDFRSWQRVRATHAQSDLPSKQRAANVKDAFALKIKNFSAKHVVIFDDVVTTGHTISELSKALKASGVERIDVWCCAKTNANNNFPPSI